MAYTLTGAGHGPAGLGLARPQDWRTATLVVADHLAARVSAAGALDVVVVPDDGFGLVLGGAAQMLRNAGAPVGLRLLLPFSGHAATIKTVHAKSWHARLVARADAVVELEPAWPATDAQVRAWRLAAYERAIGEADEVVVGWDGVEGDLTWAVQAAAHRAGKPPRNLHADLAAALGPAPGRPPRAVADRGGGASPWFGLRVD